jgi:hypothetical protein
MRSACFRAILFALAVALASLGAMTGASPAVALEGFVPGTEDVPLMAALKSSGGADVVFDSPGGRIVIAYASGRTSRAEVGAFYASALAALGWEPTTAKSPGGLGFRREGERFDIEFIPPPATTAQSGAQSGAQPGVLAVRLSLSPNR